MSRFAIGIDLGTTNSALASIDTQGASSGSPTSTTFSIPQCIDVGERESRSLLPSFAYLPGLQELPPGSMNLPWRDESSIVVGEAARKLGSRVPGRLVASAKSWLCHAGVDRTARILPWQSPIELEPISPVTASSLYLSHLREAWNHAYPEDLLEQQSVALTIPASFDEVARELTVESARRAGLEKVTLLEEPTAAFYQWMATVGRDEPLSVGETCVVIDCGGGTTDFSLLAVVEESGRPTYQRVAVGDHLLLGGDNVDMALARHIEGRLSPDRRLDLGQWWNLVLDARRMKEAMLSSDGPASMPAAVLGRGRRVVGDVLKCDVDREQVLAIALDGFFPEVGVDAEPAVASRIALQEFGLPYVGDPAITKHLASFLRRHREAMLEISERVEPAALLFNGGMFNAKMCRDRVVKVMQSWYGPAWQPRVLETSSLDLAVAHGAAQFAYLRQTGGQRIRSGASRSYYVGVGGDAGRGEGSVLCIVPLGMKEGDRQTIDELPIELNVGEPVAFPLYTSTVRPHDRAGQLLQVKPGQLAALPALTTILRGGKRSGTKRIAVRLESTLTEIGTLELYCAGRDGQQRWRLQFSTRSEPTMAATHEDAEATTPVTETWSEEQLEAGRRRLVDAFDASAEPTSAIQLPKQIESALGLGRADWPTGVLRGLWEALVQTAGERGRSVEHECRWYNLAGFCLRPGFGDPLDSFRVEQLWKLIHAGVIQAKQDRPWSEYWIMCRRVAGGLDAPRQMELGKRLLTYLPISGLRRPPRRAGSHELAEIWRAIASLEHLPAPLKRDLGGRLTDDIERGTIPIYACWSLARLAARVPLYGPANSVVPVADVEAWIERILTVEPMDKGVGHELDFALVQMARLSGDRGRDLDATVRGRLLRRLEKHDAPPAWREALTQVTLLHRAEQTRLLGDAIPPGLRVVANHA